MILFGKSVKSAVMKVLEAKLVQAQKNYEEGCKQIDEQAKVAKGLCFDGTVNQFTTLFDGTRKIKVEGE
jgi:hypothetical protein